MKIKSAQFVVSNTDWRKCPSGKPEFAFIGRSNVGKSSLINMLTGRKALAKTSGKPGKTRLINHFLINEQWYLVDLPGYGWAKVGKQQRGRFEEIITGYLLNSPHLTCVFVLIDIRLEPQAIDLEFINWLGENGLPLAIVFTKADKQSRNKNIRSVQMFEKALLASWEELPPRFITSSRQGTGRDELLGYIEGILASLS